MKFRPLLAFLALWPLVACTITTEKTSTETKGTCSPDGNQQISIRFPVTWLNPGPFTPKDDPAAGMPKRSAWVATGPVPGRAEFDVPYQATDRLLGVSFDAYGTNGKDKPQAEVHVYYQADAMTPVIELGKGTDERRPTAWGQFELSGASFKPIDLGAAGQVWIEITVQAQGYAIGQATATFLRSCDHRPV